uniref:Small ribosomal subunit protein bS16m n=1 Tax=Capra hircus TaxID=9925 RepID=A0A452EUN0_CAPHI
MVQLTIVLYKAYHQFSHLTIRLALGGCTKWPFYHIVASLNKCPKDGHFMEQLGSYHPVSNSYGKKLIALNLDQIWHCTGCGAHLSKPVEKFLGLSGYFPQHLTVVTNAERFSKTDTEATETRELTSVNIAVGIRLKSS